MAGNGSLLTEKFRLISAAAPLPFSNCKAVAAFF